jgi:hypothetical protein
MLEANNHLNQRALEDFSDEHLEDYTRWLELQMANMAVYYSQVRYEWQRREMDGKYENK